MECMPIKNVELFEDQDVIEFKGVLQSTDGGKTWVVVQQDAVVNVKGEPLPVDMQNVVLEVATDTDVFSLEDYTKFRALAQEHGFTDAEALTKLLSFWYKEQNE